MNISLTTIAENASPELHNLTLDSDTIAVVDEQVGLEPIAEDFIGTIELITRSLRAPCSFADFATSNHLFKALCDQISAGLIDPNSIFQLREGPTQDTLLSYAARATANAMTLEQALIADRARRLIELGANPNQPNSNGFSPLHIAATFGQTAIIRVLLDSGAIIDGVNSPHGITPLHAAIMNNHEFAVRLLLQEGANAFISASNGYRAIHLAAQFGHQTLIDALLSHGIDVECRTSEYLAEAQYQRSLELTTLHIAALNGHVSVVKHLICLGADVNAKNDLGDLPVHVAASNDKAAVVQTLLMEDRQTAESKNAYEFTPLHCAAANNCASAIRMLGLFNVDFEAECRNDAKALHIACAGAHHAAVLALVSSNADVNSKTIEKNTPLHIASKIGDMKIVGALLLAGADKLAKNAAGKTPVMIAKEHENFQVLNLLLAAQLSVAA